MERFDRIVELLSIHKKMSCQRLCEELFCSPSSLRRDLIELERTGTVRRVRGGAVLVAGTGHDYSSTFRESVNVEEKKYISEIARDFLSNGMSVFMDSSSTVAHLCPVLDTLRDITVLTNGVNTACMLNESEHVDMFLCGGHMRKSSASILGEASSESVKRFQADVAFISCRGVSMEGVFDADIEHATLKRHMVEGAKHAILLADHTKFNVHFFHKLCGFSQLQAVITDRSPTPELEQIIQAADCEVLY